MSLLSTEHTSFWINYTDNDQNLVNVIKIIIKFLISAVTELFSKSNSAQYSSAKELSATAVSESVISTLKHKWHIIADFSMTVKAHKISYKTSHKIILFENHNSDTLIIINWKSEILILKQCIQLSTSLTRENLDDSYWKLILINCALNSVIMRLTAVNDQDFINDNFTNMRSEQDFIFNNLIYYISKLILWMQKLNAIINTEAFTSLLFMLLTLTEKMIKKFNKQQKYLNNILYQHENHIKACKKLDIVNSEVFQFLDMCFFIVLKFWQSVIIHVIIKFESNKTLHEVILSDYIRLNKTWVIINYLLHVDSSEKSFSDLFLI